MPDMESVPSFGGTIMRTASNYVSPVLAALPQRYRPADNSGCQSCPDSSWYTTSSALFCHCAARRYISWASNLDPVNACDDREAALARLAQEQ